MNKAREQFRRLEFKGDSRCTCLVLMHKVLTKPYLQDATYSPWMSLSLMSQQFADGLRLKDEEMLAKAIQDAETVPRRMAPSTCAASTLEAPVG